MSGDCFEFLIINNTLDRQLFLLFKTGKVAILTIDVVVKVEINFDTTFMQ